MGDTEIQSMDREKSAGVREKEPSEARLDVSVIVPVTGPVSEGFQELVARVSEQLEKLGKTWEFIFINDGNGPEVGRKLSEVKRIYPAVKIITFHHQFGESVALTAGFERTRGEFIITMASYLQVAPEDIPKVLAPLEGEFDFVSAWRHPRVDPLPNRIQSLAFNWITRRITNVKFHDLNCHLRGMRRKVIEEISIYGDLFRFLPVIAQRQGFRITEVKVRHLEERGKTGFFGFGMYIRRFLDILTMFFLIRFTKKPLRFFGLIGTVFFAAGFLICLYHVYMKIATQMPLRDKPMLILGVLLTVLGIQTVSMGLIGEIIIFTHARTIKEYQVEQFLE